MTGGMAFSPFPECEERLKERVATGLEKSLQDGMKGNGIRIKQGTYRFQDVRKGIQKDTQDMRIGQESVPDPVKGSFGDIKKFTQFRNIFKPSRKTAVNKGNEKLYAIGAVRDKEGAKKGVG